MSKLDYQLDSLYKVQEQLRDLQDDGFWEYLQDAKEDVIRLIKELEKRKKGQES